MSNNLSNKKVWLIGAGPMAVDHARVLQHLNIEPIVIGRGETSAQRFEKETGIEVQIGGIGAYLAKELPRADTFIIIATGTEALLPTLLKFKELEFNYILIEKPAAVSIQELLANEDNLRPIQEKAFVAYNRRFYPSVEKAVSLIKEDGGLQSMYFEFTEWSHKIEPLQKAPGVKENWFFANSTHVVDLAFYIAGQPKEWQAFSQKGTLNWHDKSFFVGAGITEQGVLFSYHSNWESAGNWNLSLMTKKRKIILNPLEILSTQNRGETKKIPVNIQNSVFKPGLELQLEFFLKKNEKHLFSLKNHISFSKKILYKILT